MDYECTVLARPEMDSGPASAHGSFDLLVGSALTQIRGQPNETSTRSERVHALFRTFHGGPSVKRDLPIGRKCAKIGIGKCPTRKRKTNRPNLGARWPSTQIDALLRTRRRLRPPTTHLGPTKVVQHEPHHPETCSVSCPPALLSKILIFGRVADIVFCRTATPRHVRLRAALSPAHHFPPLPR